MTIRRSANNSKTILADGRRLNVDDPSTEKLSNEMV